MPHAYWFVVDSPCGMFYSTMYYFYWYKFFLTNNLYIFKWLYCLFFIKKIDACPSLPPEVYWNKSTILLHASLIQCVPNLVLTYCYCHNVTANSISLHIDVSMFANELFYILFWWIFFLENREFWFWWHFLLWQVQKMGSVGRSIDVASFKNYEELC